MVDGTGIMYIASMNALTSRTSWTLCTTLICEHVSPFSHLEIKGQISANKTYHIVSVDVVASITILISFLLCRMSGVVGVKRTAS